MEIKDLLEYTAFNIKLDEIIYEFNNGNYVKSADLCNKLLIKYILYTNLESEMKEILNYKKLSDEKNQIIYCKLRLI